MGIIADESIRKVLEATDIVDLINSYIPLRRAGSAWKGVCPFHNDTNPSMTVNPVRQGFMCFACQTGGDALSFVMKYENIPFVDAVRKLADRAGIVLVEEQFDAEQQARRKKTKTLIDVNKLAAEYFHSLLNKDVAAQHARDYLNARGYGAEMVQRWNVGWAPERSRDFLDWARSKYISYELLEEAGLAAKGDNGTYYARFRDRLMFPICNDRGECVGFSGRLLKEASNMGKYVNTPETSVFKKSMLCFGLDKAQKGIRDNKRVLICEGQMDVIACHEAGIDYAVASLGTAFTEDHARLLKRRTDKAILCFDADGAGVKASDKAFEALAAENMEVMMVQLPSSGPDGKADDPDSFIKREGAEAFHELVNRADSFLVRRVEMARQQGRFQDAGSTAAFAQEMARLVSSVKEPLSRDIALSDVATRLQTGLDTMRYAVDGVLRQQRQYGRRADRSVEQEQVSLETVPPMIVDRAIQILCQLALQNTKTQELIAERIEDLIEPMDMLAGGELLKRILEHLPNPQDAAAVHVFIRSLPSEQSSALLKMNIEPFDIQDPQKVVDEACTALSHVALEKQLQTTLASLKNSNLSSEERFALMKKSVDIKTLLNNMSPRIP